MKSYLSLEPLIPWRQTPGHLDWNGLFERTGPLQVEIGCGSGDRLVNRAASEPEIRLVGIDNSWPAIRRALRKIATTGTDGVMLMQAKAHQALARSFAPGSVSRMEALFPRPWPRPEDEDKRLLGKRFLALVNSRLRPGGEFYLVTDVKPYLDWALGRVDRAGFGLETGCRGAGLDTKYERKWVEQGVGEFYELKLTKTGELLAPEWVEVDLRYYRLKKFDPRGFALGPRSADPLVVFKDLIFDPEREKGILRAMAEEDGFKQSFYLEFLIRDGGWFLRLAPGCGVVPTRAVQLALDLAREQAEA